MAKIKSAQIKDIEKLDNLAQKYDWIIRADVFFREEKDTNVKVKICEIRLSLPGPRIFVSSDKKNFEAAIAKTIKDLEVQLKKQKDMMRAY